MKSAGIDIRKIIDAIEDESMLAVERLLALFLGIARPAEKVSKPKRRRVE